jgi:hypothetical protein
MQAQTMRLSVNCVRVAALSSAWRACQMVIRTLSVRPEHGLPVPNTANLFHEAFRTLSWAREMHGCQFVFPLSNEARNNTACGFHVESIRLGKE